MSDAELDPTARALLDHVRAHDALSSPREAAILAKLQARHAAGDPGLSLASPSPASAIGIGKIVLALALAAGLAVPLVGLLQGDAPASAPVTVPATNQAPAPAPGPEPAPAPSEPVTASAPVPEAPPAAPSSPAPVASRKARAEPVPTRALAPAPATDPRAEIELMQRAQAALAAGDARQALALLDRHGREFPDGVLAAERTVSHAQARCSLGEVEAARREVAAFLRTHPSSVLRERARGICVERDANADTDSAGTGHGSGD